MEVNWREQLSNFRSLIISRPGKGQPFSNKSNRTKFSVDKKNNEAFRVEYISTIREETLCRVKSLTRSRPRPQI